MADAYELSDLASYYVSGVLDINGGKEDLVVERLTVLLPYVLLIRLLNSKLVCFVARLELDVTV